MELTPLAPAVAPGFTYNASPLTSLYPKGLVAPDEPRSEAALGLALLQGASGQITPSQPSRPSQPPRARLGVSVVVEGAVKRREKKRDSAAKLNTVLFGPEGEPLPRPLN